MGAGADRLKTLESRVGEPPPGETPLTPQPISQTGLETIRKTLAQSSLRRVAEDIRNPSGEGPYVVRAGKAVARGARKAVADVTEFLSAGQILQHTPPDSMTLEQASERARREAREIGSVVGGLGGETLGADTGETLETLGETAAYEAGTAPLVAARGVARAGSLTKEAVRHVGAGPLATTGEQLLRSKGRLLAEEVAGVAGETVGSEVTEDSGGGVELVGSLGGTVAGTSSLAVGRRVFNRALPGGAERAAVRTLESYLGDPKQTAERLANFKPRGGVNPTAGAIADDPGLSQLEQTLMVNNSQLAAEAKRRSEEGARTLLTQYSSLIEGGDTRRGQELIRIKIEGRVRELETLTSQLPTGAGARSKMLQDALMVEKQRVFKPLQDAYDEIAVAADEMGIQLSGAKVHGALDKLVQDVGGSESALRLPAEVINRTRELKLSSAKWTQVHEYTKFLGAVKRATNDPTTRYQIGVLEDAARGLMRDPMVVRKIGGLEELNKAYETAIDTFRRGEMRRLLTGNRERRVAGDATIGRLIKRNKAPGSIEDAQRLSTATANDPALRKQAIDAIIARGYRDHFRNEDGVVDARKLRAYLENHSEALQAFPEVQERLRNVLTAQRAVADLGIVGPPSRMEFEAASLAQYTADPAQAIDDIVRNKDERAWSRLVTSFDGDPAALAGARRELWMNLTNKALVASEAPGLAYEVTGPAVRRVVDDYGRLLTRAYGNQHVMRMLEFANDIDVVRRQFVPPGSRTVPSTRPEEHATDTLKVLLANRIYGPAMKAVRAAGAFSGFLSELDDFQARAVLEDALLNPRHMEMLARKATPENERTLVRYLTANVITAPLRSVWATEDQQEPSQ